MPGGKPEWCPAIHEYFRGGSYSSRFLTEGGVPFTMSRINIIKGWGRCYKSRKAGRGLPKDMCTTSLMRVPTPHGQPLVFAPRLTGKGPVQRRLFRHG